jgi:8-oxo-dGTP pyrophosphatase MutT (NUDIX family)
MKQDINISACVVLINEEGLILGVSRKNNHNDFGLVGGSMDPIDGNDPVKTAIRECKEETGLDITDLKLVFAIHKGGNMGFTYLAKYSGEINHNEPHVVKWVPFQTLVRGSFGRYNQLVAESLDDMDVDYVYRLYKGSNN